MADYSKTIWNGWINEQDLVNNFDWTPGDQIILCANKYYNDGYSISGVVLYRSLTTNSFVIVTRDTNYDYDIKAPWYPNILGSKKDININSLYFTNIDLTSLQNLIDSYD